MPEEPQLEDTTTIDDEDKTIYLSRADCKKMAQERRQARNERLLSEEDQQRMFEERKQKRIQGLLF